QLKDVYWEDAFDTIVKTYGYTYTKEGNIYHVLTTEDLESRREGGLQSQLVTLEYANIAQTATVLKSMMPDGKVEPLLSGNQLLITGTPAQLRDAQQLLTQIDRRMLQVQIDTKIVRTALTKNETLGIDWNAVVRVAGAKRPTTLPFANNGAERNPESHWNANDIQILPEGQTEAETTTTTTSGGGVAAEETTKFPNAFGFPFVKETDFTFGTIDFSQFSMVMSMLQNRANTKIISNPRIVVLNHQAARVQAGREIGLPTFERNESTGSFEITGYEPRNDGIQLQVTPHISENQDITLTVKPELTRFIGFVPVVTGSNVLSPEFDTTVAETQVVINSGDTLVIGGFINETEADNRKQVPYLAGIPIVGALFRNISPSKEKTETIIFVTVTIADDVFNKEALKKWRNSQAEYQAFTKFSEEDFFRKRSEENVRKEEDKRRREEEKKLRAEDQRKKKEEDKRRKAEEKLKKQEERRKQGKKGFFFL
ncbi:MAG: secretin N-terminal domain-containing protein, partial [Candidatus Omnitrophica bacterium]|nr:secretin N-terminal domain-containing protein [Candidatus Omnitrophota bacterium]